MLNCVPLFTTPRTIVHQTPLSIGFPRQEYWNGLLYPPPRDFLTLGLNQSLLHYRQILYHLSSLRSPICCLTSGNYFLRLILCISERYAIYPAMELSLLSSTPQSSNPCNCPGMRWKNDHRNSDRDIINVLDEELTSQRQSSWNHTLAHKVNSRQDIEEILATQGKRRPSVMRDMMSEGLLDYQGDSWKPPPPITLRVSSYCKSFCFL